MAKGPTQLNPQLLAAVKRLANEVRAARERNGWSQDAPAKTAKMPLSKYQRLEQGSGDCRITAVIQAFSGFGLDFIDVVRSALASVTVKDIDKKAEEIQARDHILELALVQLRRIHAAGKSGALVELIQDKIDALPVKRVSTRAAPAPARGRRTARSQEAANRKQKQAGSTS